MGRSERIAQQLGMSHGAAANKLRKNILFSFAKRLKEDICFKCKEQIVSVDDLSIEHKLPWENISSSLFWDLDNITFSHLKCNRQHTYNMNEDKKIVGPAGTSWCFRCKKFHPVEMFSQDSFRSNGLRNVCREQMKLYKKRYFESKPEAPDGRASLS